MAVREARVSGLEYVAVATQLLQRIRRADPQARLWEAADLQWWWRQPRPSDEIDQLFWVEDGDPLEPAKAYGHPRHVPDNRLGTATR